MNIRSNIGQKIQKLRQEFALSQEEFARKANVTYATLTKIEAGVIKRPSFFIVAKIAKALGCSLDDLVFNKRISKHLIKFEASGTKVYIPEERYSIDLSLTENPLKFSNNIVGMIDKQKHFIDHYPDPYHHELRKALSRKFKIRQEKFICGAGADGLIENIVRILINPGDQVILPVLTFLNASFAATIAGGVPVFSKMTKDFHIDFDDINKKINNGTKMIFICNPNNPTGIVTPREKIHKLLKSTSVLAVVDEANIEFGGESVIDYVNEFENLIVIRTFSKAYGLAGLRLGYCAGNEELLHYIWRLRPPFVNTTLAQKAAVLALDDQEHIAKSCSYIAKERLFLTEQLTKLGFSVVPSASNCILVKVAPLFKNSTAFCKLLNNNDCTVVDGKHFESLGNSYIRIAPQLHSTNAKFVSLVEGLAKKAITDH
jgi:histidinol-phosphate aminotransferase